MILIRRVYGSSAPPDRNVVRQVQEIFRASYPEVAGYASKIPRMLNDPVGHQYRTILLVSETSTHRITGFALLIHFHEIRSSLLDFLVVSPGVRGSGIGGALYEAAREYLRDLGSMGIYMEVLPDDPALEKRPGKLEENRKRLRFYEQYGVLPIVGTDYETPVAGDDAAPFLLFDPLARQEPLGRREARAAVRLILDRKYAHIVGPDYMSRVVRSFRDDPVRFRPPRYVRPRDEKPEIGPSRLQKAFALVRGEAHAIHHVRERGYVERPARIGAIHESVAATGLFAAAPVKKHGEARLRSVHDGDFVSYLKAACGRMPDKSPVYPYVFPIRRPERRPKDLAVRAGYYCIDTFTPLYRGAYSAACEAVDVALTAANELLRGRRVAYALCRPPGHHAGRRTFGGFCYFNNAAIAADLLAARGKVAVLDIDYHHGNGTQDIFYQRGDVLTLSIHGHPNIAYPYFSGFSDETGEGRGRGLNRNYPLPEGADRAPYLDALDRAMRHVRRFAPAFLVVSLGFDILKGDPTGTFRLPVSVEREIGARIAEAGTPILFVQEGGYNLRNLRRGAPALFTGLARALDGKHP
ncbi:MAG: histone deacetylase family protein [Candidatus Eisenbacteria bacterium]